jgi:hypothetical protein
MAPSLTCPPVGLHACIHLNVIGGINDHSYVAWAGGVFLEHVAVFLQLFSSANVWSRSALAPLEALPTGTGPATGAPCFSVKDSILLALTLTRHTRCG